MPFSMLLSSGIEARLVDVSIGFNYHCYHGREPRKDEITERRYCGYRSQALQTWAVRLNGGSHSPALQYIFHGWACAQLNLCPHHIA